MKLKRLLILLGILSFTIGVTACEFDVADDTGNTVIIINTSSVDDGWDFSGEVVFNTTKESNKTTAKNSTTKKVTTKKTTTKKTTTAKTVSTSAKDVDQITQNYKADLTKWVNDMRRMNGMNELGYSDQLAEIAEIRALDLKTSPEHIRPNGDSFADLIADRGIQCIRVGEVLAIGSSNPVEAEKKWAADVDDTNTILDPEFEKMGIGVVNVNGIYYYAIEFIAV
ncbi:MAG: CAP domain-containing protein [Oscillospiraceae bacterium]|jgi:uncharacterized protein YkwD|nr:CAP domain-containing protein [Oscillospiraceae bacterium]